MDWWVIDWWVIDWWVIDWWVIDWWVIDWWVMDWWVIDWWVTDWWVMDWWVIDWWVIDWWVITAVLMAKRGHILVSLLDYFSSTKFLKPIDHYIPPSGHYMYRQFNIHNSTFCPHSCIYVFCVDLRTNSHYFPIQH